MFLCHVLFVVNLSCRFLWHKNFSRNLIRYHSQQAIPIFFSACFVYKKLMKFCSYPLILKKVNVGLLLDTILFSNVDVF